MAVPIPNLSLSSTAASRTGTLTGGGIRFGNVGSDQTNVLIYVGIAVLAGFLLSKL